MKFDVYLMNSWNGYTSPDNWIRNIKNHSFKTHIFTGLILGINSFVHEPNDITYLIVLFGFGIGINIKNK